MARVEKDRDGGWIARRRDGSIITDPDWRWASRSAARGAVAEIDMLEDVAIKRQSVTEGV